MTLEEGRLTTRQARIPERFEQRCLDGLLPGDILEVEVDTALWADENGLLWLDGGYGLERNAAQKEAAESFAYVIQTAEGCVVDIFNAPSAPSYIPTYTNEEIVEAAETDINRRLPVVALVTTQKEYETFAEIFKLEHGTTPLEKLKAAKARRRPARKMPAKDTGAAKSGVPDDSPPAPGFGSL